MKPFDQFPPGLRARIRFVLTDVDDTLTDGPRLPAATYLAIERLHAAGITVVPVTAASSGWCDLMCRMWPIGAVIGENGGLCFRRDPTGGEPLRRYWLEDAERQRSQKTLTALAPRIIAAAGGELAHDQRYRETTLAFRHPAGASRADDIRTRLHNAGARTTVNSLWLLGWLGGFDKLAMTRRMMAEWFATDIEHDAASVLYVGDSLNDEPMFGFFPNSVGVATVRTYLDRLATPPKWITQGGGGAGFAEVAEMLLGAA